LLIEEVSYIKDSILEHNSVVEYLLKVSGSPHEKLLSESKLNQS